MLTLHLGLISYSVCAALQRELVDARSKDLIPDVLLLLEHPPTITVGRGTNFENVLTDHSELSKLGIVIEESDRGGDVTYHGPGQLVGYPILQLQNHGKDLHVYLRKLEGAIIDAIGKFGLDGRRFPPHTGVWVGDKKIAAIGVNVRRWVSSHGFALNVHPDMSHFRHIIPCGIRGYGVTSLSQECADCPSMNLVSHCVEQAMSRIFPGQASNDIEARIILDRYCLS